MPKERGILFSGEMVRAILEGRKTQTRRIVKLGPPPRNDGSEAMFRHGNGWRYTDVDYRSDTAVETCPYGQPGDRLWVRETWGWFPSVFYEGTIGHTPKPTVYRYNPSYRVGVDAAERQGIAYRANGDNVMYEPYGGWKPSIHMPRWASRITRDVLDVRVQRLQDISAEDAIAEGLACITKDGKNYKYGIPGNDDIGWEWHHWRISPIDAFARLWDLFATDGTRWDDNPWVWAITFNPLTSGGSNAK